MKNKKGQMMEQLGGIAVGIATLAILLVVCFLILGQGRQQVISNNPCNTTGYYYNASNSTAYCCKTGAPDCTAAVNQTGLSAEFTALRTTTNAVADIPGWIPLIVIVLVGAVLIGLVKMFRR